MRPAQTPAFPVPAESAWADGETIDAIAVDTGTWNLVTDGEAHDVTATVTLDTTVSTTPWQGTLQLVRGTDEVVAEKNVGVAVGGDTGSVVFQVTEAGTYKVVDKGAPTTASAEFIVNNVASMADLFAAGKATQGTDSATGRVVNAGEDGVFTISGVDGTKQHKVAPTYALPEGASAPVAVEVYDADGSGADNTGYFADNDGVPGEEYTETTLANACKTGAYWVAVQPKAGDTAAQAYAGGVLYVKVVLQQSTLEGVYAYDGSDVEDTTFTYDAEAQAVNFAVNGEELAGATAVYYKADGSFVGADGKTAPTDAGSYYAIVTLDGQTATVPFEVGVLDLSAVSVAVNDVEWTKGSAVDAATVKAGATVNGEKLKTNTSLAGKLSFNAGLVDRLGEYTAAIAPADDEDKNITGTATASFKAVEQVVAAEKFFYDDVIFENAFKADPVRVFNNSVEPFSVDKIAVQDANGNDYAKSRYTVSLTDEEGNEVSSATEAGTYVVTVSMVPGSDWALGGKATGKFTVTKGTVAAAKVSVTFDGKAVGNNFKAPYDGTNLADKFAVSVTLGGEQLAEGTDYEVVFKDLDKTGTAQVVDSVVNVNRNGYQLEVKGVGYAGTAVFKFSVQPVTAKALKVDEGAFGGVAWTGEAVAPRILYSTKAAADSTAADWKVLDPEMYSSVYMASEKDYANGEWDGTYTDGNVIPASEVVDAGTYAVIVSLYSDVANLAFDASLSAEAQRTLHFDVVKTAHFIDVPADAWYADGVYTAWENTYMEGIAEGIFAPENAMTRAEFAQLVFNMAGGQKDESGKEFPTQFADVPANAWYAQAVEWAARYGIVNGTSETTFAPNETISREQIAAMFYRYAGNGAEADLSVLDQFDDADQISAYAENAMAWAVENGYVNGVSDTALAPSETATRAQIAAIAVRVQPEEIA